MTHLLFDGSFDGLMTLVFDTYKQREEVGVVGEYSGADSLLPTRFIQTDMDKARRIQRYINKELGGEFAFMVKAAFLSRRESRFRSIVRVIHLACGMGRKVLDLLGDDVLDFIACQKEVRMEAHRFQGLLRFRQMRDGSMLATFAPKNNVLSIILPHFADRFPGERLLLYDELRRLAGLAGQGRIEVVQVASITPQETGNEADMQELWRTFFSHLAIRERANPKLQRQHLPKYTWKNLTEMR